MKSYLGHLATGVLKSYGRSFEFGREGRDLKAYALVHLMEGEGYYQDIRNGKVRVKRNDVIMVFPGLAHTYGCETPEDKWIEQFVVFDGPLFKVLEDEGLLDRTRPVMGLHSDPKWGSDFYRFIVDHREGKGVIQPELSLAELHLLLVRLMKQMGQEGSWVEEAVRGLGEGLSEELDMDALASSLGMAEQTFRKRFKDATGYSPYQYRLIRRLEWARDHLLKGRDKLEVLARKCGFCDHYHFSRQFKKTFGLSPGAYRKSHGLRVRA